ncbi:MAG TPA: hypothetical protein VGK99_08690 [Acidobacteriota bacterium]
MQISPVSTDEIQMPSEGNRSYSVGPLVHVDQVIPHQVSNEQTTGKSEHNGAAPNQFGWKILLKKQEVANLLRRAA